MAQENRRCGDCRFSERMITGSGASYDYQRQCRRSAPTAYSNGGAGHWPRVLLDDWCFEFEAARGGSPQPGQRVATAKNIPSATAANVAADWSDVIAQLNSSNRKD
ncbi:hypothetical protein [Bradyrhizobium sp. CCBAU 51765]|uniref:hypothetical protein n=1 Tax=Bradyrhizobium sp. CCBAU 51765 TaxID=1325102 RepID=UPI001888F70F|nr:hypothetical protein [Bradyrhizobium sp. CCBAU 51765]